MRERVRTESRRERNWKPIAGTERGNECECLGRGDANTNNAFGFLGTAGGAKGSQRGRYEEGATTLNNRGTERACRTQTLPAERYMKTANGRSRVVK